MPEHVQQVPFPRIRLWRSAPKLPQDHRAFVVEPTFFRAYADEFTNIWSTPVHFAHFCTNFEVVELDGERASTFQTGLREVLVE